jgi:hypothetical protein
MMPLELSMSLGRAISKVRKNALQVQSITLGTLAHFRHFSHFLGVAHFSAL